MRFSQLEPWIQPREAFEERFQADPRPEKFALHSGVFKDAENVCRPMEVVRKAEKRLLETEKSKNYLPIHGDDQFNERVRELVLGRKHPSLDRSRVIQTAGGTAALRLMVEFVKKLPGSPTLWIPEPTWGNHHNIFEAGGITTETYPWFFDSADDEAVEKTMSALGAIPGDAAVLIHACCHNPTSMDPDADLWDRIATLATEGGWLPVFDVAFPGFADGWDEDLDGMRKVLGAVPESLVAVSLSKAFGIYRERVGALLALAEDEASLDKAYSLLRKETRSTYSYPPSHGALIVSSILGDPSLRATWDRELKGVRIRIQRQRSEYVRRLAERGVARDMSHVEREKGIFMWTGLQRDEVDRLREEFAIHMSGSGRINCTAMTDKMLDRLCDAVAAVVSGS